MAQRMAGEQLTPEERKAIRKSVKGKDGTHYYNKRGKLKERGDKDPYNRKLENFDLAADSRKGKETLSMAELRGLKQTGDHTNQELIDYARSLDPSQLTDRTLAKIEKMEGREAAKGDPTPGTGPNADPATQQPASPPPAPTPTPTPAPTPTPTPEPSSTPGADNSTNDSYNDNSTTTTTTTEDSYNDNRNNQGVIGDGTQDNSDNSTTDNSDNSINDSYNTDKSDNSQVGSGNTVDNGGVVNTGEGDAVGGNNQTTYGDIDQSKDYNGNVSVGGNNTGNINSDFSTTTNSYGSTEGSSGSTANNNQYNRAMAGVNALMASVNNAATAGNAGSTMSLNLGDFDIPDNRARMGYLEDSVSARTQEFYDRGEMALNKVFGKYGGST